MYAQAFELPGTEPSARLEQSINDELLPALRTEEGFCGALSLVRPETGEILLLVFWETENEAASPLSPRCSTTSGPLADERHAQALGDRRANIAAAAPRPPAIRSPLRRTRRPPTLLQARPSPPLVRRTHRRLASFCLEPTGCAEKSGGTPRCERTSATPTRRCVHMHARIDSRERAGNEEGAPIERRRGWSGGSARTSVGARAGGGADRPKRAYRREVLRAHSRRIDSRERARNEEDGVHPVGAWVVDAPYQGRACTPPMARSERARSLGRNPPAIRAVPQPRRTVPSHRRNSCSSGPDCHLARTYVRASAREIEASGEGR